MKIGHFFTLFPVKKIIKIRYYVFKILLFKLYEYSYKLFPENTLKENTEISTNVRFYLLELNSEYSSTEQEECLKTTVLKDDTFRQQIVNFHLLATYAYSKIDTDEANNTKQDSLEKAKKLIPNCKEITDNSFKNLSKFIKNELKILQSKSKHIGKDKINQELLKLINPITISPSHVIFFVSIFYTLFTVSGFIYNKFLFQNFGISVSDFFDISDYLSSSINEITLTIIPTVMGAVFFFIGYENELYKRLYEEQFEIKSKESLIDKYTSPFIVVFSIIIIVIKFLITKEIYYFLIATVVLFVLFTLPYWKYIKNKPTVIATLSAIVYLVSFTMSGVDGRVKKIKNGEYESPYKLTFVDPYKKYSNLAFVSSNSKYVFMWDSSIKEMIVLDKDAIFSYTSKNKKSQ